MTTNSENSDQQEGKEASEEGVEIDRAEAVTDGGQPLALEERLDTGSKSWEEVHSADGATYGEMTIRRVCRTNSDTFGGRYVERG